MNNRFSPFVPSAKLSLSILLYFHLLHSEFAFSQELRMSGGVFSNLSLMEAVHSHSTAGERVDFIFNALSQAKETDRRYAELIVVCATIEDQRVVGMLLDKIGFKWVEFNEKAGVNVTYYPAQLALLNLGKFAVPELTRYLEHETNIENVGHALSVYKRLEGSRAWTDMLNGPLKRFSERDRLRIASTW